MSSQTIIARVPFDRGLIPDTSYTVKRTPKCLKYPVKTVLNRDTYDRVVLNTESESPILPGKCDTYKIPLLEWRRKVKRFVAQASNNLDLN